jgi:uncharacterized protein YuzE
MPYINYDENGNIIGHFANQQYEEQLYFDIPNDGKIYKIENNKLVEDTNAEKKQLIQSAKEIRDKAINEITNAKLLDDLQLDAGTITQTVYDARKTARLAQLAEVQNTFYTTTGLTKPTTITA